jgi:pyruvate kinase
MQRRTKIVATLGPATDHKETLRKMINAGLDVARINFSHGEAAEHRRRAKELREAADESQRDVGLLGDLQGPKIRVQRFKERAVELQDGASFFLDSSFRATSCCSTTA